MHCTIPSPDHVGPETPLRLNIAAALAFPDDLMTVLGLRRETVLPRSSTRWVMAVAAGVP